MIICLGNLSNSVEKLVFHGKFVDQNAQIKKVVYNERVRTLNRR